MSGNHKAYKARMKKFLPGIHVDSDLDSSGDEKGKSKDDTDSDKDKKGKDDISTPTSATTFTVEQLNKMTKDQLHHLLSSHGKRVNNKSKIRKGELIELIVEGNFNWRPAVDKSEGKDKKGKSKSNDIVSD